MFKKIIGILFLIAAIVCFGVAAPASAQEIKIVPLAFGDYENTLAASADGAKDTLISSTAEDIYFSIPENYYPLELIIFGDITDLNSGEGVTFILSPGSGRNMFVTGSTDTVKTTAADFIKVYSVGGSNEEASNVYKLTIDQYASAAATDSIAYAVNGYAKVQKR